MSALAERYVFRFLISNIGVLRLIGDEAFYTCTDGLQTEKITESAIPWHKYEFDIKIGEAPIESWCRALEFAIWQVHLKQCDDIDLEFAPAERWIEMINHVLMQLRSELPANGSDLLN